MSSATFVMSLVLSTITVVFKITAMRAELKILIPGFISKGIPVQDDWTTFHNSYAFLGCIFNVTL